MRITKFESLAEFTSPASLKPISMQRLGKLVVIAGKNGAGKSRLFAQLRNHAIQWQGKIAENALLEQQTNYKNAIRQNVDSPNIQSWENQFIDIQVRLDRIKSISISPESQSAISIVNFVPKSISLNDPQQDTIGTLDQKFEQSKNPGTDSIASSALSYIQSLQNQWRIVTHQDYEESHPTERQGVIDSYTKLKNLVKSLLKEDLKYLKNGICTIFNQPIGSANLSDGQKILLQLAVAIHAQGASLNDMILLLDEPENHLHPSVVIDFFDSLNEVVSNGQIWIATHSVPLLSHINSIDPMAIWYMDKGEIKHAGKKPSEVLSGLLGDEVQIEKLKLFLSLPAELASTNFAAESLRSPTTVDSATNDPQIIQIKDFINELRLGTAVKILDFGAGKGRVLEGFAELEGKSGRNIHESIDYIAFDGFESDSESCKKQIERFYESSQGKYFNKTDDLFAVHGEETFDVIIMCNVLHEIEPSAWLSLFDIDGPIQRCLKATGFLLLVEDLRIPVGEKAHANGFFILDTTHLRTLFSVTNDHITNSLFSHSDARQDGRLKAHWIAKPLLKNINTESRKKAISNLMQTSKESIKAIRTKNSDYSNGMLHGFWSQQLANCVLYLETQ